VTEQPVRSAIRVGLEGPVAVVELARGPNNLLGVRMLTDLADAFEDLAGDSACRAIVLCAEGKHFCAGMNLAAEEAGTTNHVTEPGRRPEGSPLYAQAIRLFSAPLPVVAAIQGAAIGGGLGLALVADFRVAARDARLAANFTKLGLHHGFGLTETLPRLVGGQRAARMLYTGAEVSGTRAAEIGLCDEAAPASELRASAHGLATAIAGSAPLAVRSVRATLRRELLAALPAAMDREHAEQVRLSCSRDAREGIKAARERRPPVFSGE
jgi:2-(1,2-epoxy-1,2-dihydrophenyl)acetyl-CoA isomerase